MMRKLLPIILLFAVLSTFAYAHDEADGTLDHMDENLKSNSLWLTGIASLIVFVVIIYSMTCKKRSEGLNWLLFLLIVIPVVIATVYVTWSTIYLNVVSDTGGPVHWHTDFEIWKCGEKLDMIDPTGALNRVGTPVFHEHGDDRIHVEGVVVRKKDVDLHTFIEVIGGSLTREHLVLPTNEGTVEARNGDQCNGQEGKLQMFVYRVTNPDPTQNTGFIYTQFKMEDFENYLLAPYAIVPPGDCIILEYDVDKPGTDKICETYRVAEEKGRLSHGG